MMYFNTLLMIKVVRKISGILIKHNLDTMFLGGLNHLKTIKDISTF